MPAKSVRYRPTKNKYVKEEIIVGQSCVDRKETNSNSFRVRTSNSAIDEQEMLVAELD